MTDIKFGEPLALGPGRPAWLAPDVMVMYYNAVDCADQWKFRDIEAKYRLPADHFAYTAIYKGFEPWGGGDNAPDDWDGGNVLIRCGFIDGATGASWNHLFGSADIIGYHKRTEAPAATPPAPVAVEVPHTFTEAEAHKHYGSPLTPYALNVLRKFGIIRPETIAERFARETGHEVTPAVESALAWAQTEYGR